jgi:predicted ribosome quality control (RQC) complex YloA/Tae2 family protein
MKEYMYVSDHDHCTYTVRVGETAQENWDIISDSGQNDIWFHVGGNASCHVVLSCNEIKKKPHKSVINYCASLCKDGSKLKNVKNVTIIYTEIKNVKKSNTPGSVTTKNIKKTKA